MSLAKELKMLWNMRMKMIPIIVGTLVTASISLVKNVGLENIGRIETIQTSGLLWSVKILRRALDI